VGALSIEINYGNFPQIQPGMLPSKSTYGALFLNPSVGHHRYVVGNDTVRCSSFRHSF